MSSAVDRLRRVPPGRAVVVTIVVLVAAAIIADQLTRGPAPTYEGSGAHPFASSNSRYGPKITLPPSAMTVARTFVRTAVLRTDPGASWDLVTPRLRSGSTRASWATGDIPVMPFPKWALGQVKYKVDRARQRDILLEVEISSTNASVQAAFDYLEMIPAGSDWKISYFAPVGYPPPIPAEQ